MAAAVVTALSVGASLAWVLLDRTPPSWDDGYYLTKSLEMYDTLADKGVTGYAVKFLTVMKTRPPLIAALPTPIYLVVGRKHRAAYAVNLLFLAITCGAVYGIARAYAEPRAGLIAVSALTSIPVIYSLSHWYLVECGLVALVCSAVYLMAGWNESSRAGRAGMLGIAFGLGLLMKASFLFYVAIPFGYFILRWRQSALRTKPAAAFLAACLIAAPWYAVNARGMMHDLLRAGSAETATVYGTGAAFSASAMGRYMSEVGNATPWLYLVALALLVGTSAASLDHNTRRGLVLGLLWLSPVIFLTMGHYRDIRYAAPLYPAVALMLGWLADAAIRRRGAIVTAGVCIVLFLGWLSMIQSSFGAPGTRLNLSGLLLSAPRLSYARPYDRVPWPHSAILAGIYRLSQFNGGERRSVLLGTNSVRFNADNFALAAVEDRLPFEIATTAYESDATALARALERASIFIYKDGGERDESNFNILGHTAIRQALAGSRFAELPLSRALPDGGVLHVLQNTTANTATNRRFEAAGAFLSAGLDQIPSCSVTFADKLQLAGIGVSRVSRGIEVKYRWRCIRPMDRDYWCFTHIVDQKGKVIGYLDHPILNGQPPTSAWKLGDVAVERLVFQLPQEDSGAYDLRVGAFHSESGERLLISESTFPVIQKHTAAVIGSSRQ